MIHIAVSLGIMYILIEFLAFISIECGDFSGFCYSPFHKAQAILKLNWGKQTNKHICMPFSCIQLQDWKQKVSGENLIVCEFVLCINVV